MKVSAGLAVLTTVVGVLAAPASGAASPGIDVSIRRLGDRVLVATVPGPQSTNVIALRTSRGIVVIDTEVSPSLTVPLRRRIEAEMGTGHFAALINTHGHGDHTYGNQVFADVPIIGHESVASTMRAAEDRREATAVGVSAVVDRLDQRLASAAPDSTEASELRSKVDYYRAIRDGLSEGFVLTPPSIGFGSTLHLDFGDLTLELVWFGVAHSAGDVLVYCPEEGLLATGDLLAPDAEPYLDSERIPQLGRWIESLVWVLEENRSLRAIVPGHGAMLDDETVWSALEYSRAQQQRFAGRTSAFREFRTIEESKGLDVALDALREFSEQPSRYYLLHPEVDSYAFGRMMDGQVEEALRIFTVLAELFPDADMAHDSLGEAYLRLGETDRAAAAFRRALEANPENRNSRSRLDEIVHLQNPG